MQPFDAAPTADQDPRPAAHQETQTRILDAAEALFLEHGYDGTSMRMITAARGREPRRGQLPLRREGRPRSTRCSRGGSIALHDERLALLERLEAAAGGKPLPCERILAALFMRARLRWRATRARGGAHFLRLLGRAYVDPAPALRAASSRSATPRRIARFKDAFARALPQHRRATSSPGACTS